MIDLYERWNDVRSAANGSVDQSPAAPPLHNRNVLCLVKSINLGNFGASTTITWYSGMYLAINRWNDGLSIRFG